VADAIRAGDLATRLGASLHGDPERPIRGAATLTEAGPEQVAFYANPRYREALRATRAGAVLLDVLIVFS
jgi:UDP-3-O-[3-hydroxymyristoyl] glucosamine N-acyltransferase